MLFDVHHHFVERENGIYNYGLGEVLPVGYFSVGLHPNEIDENWEQNLEKIKKSSQNPHCVAVGECGMDAFVKADELLQEQVFEQQILWANEIQKPVIIHCVRRFSQLLKIGKKAQTPMIIHGFNKKREVAESLLDKGFYLSFGRALLYNEFLQSIAQKTPLDKIFLETDTSEMEIEKVYQKLSELKKMELLELDSVISENVRKVFQIN